MPETLSFTGGLNAVAAPDKLAPTEVQAAYNIDFSIEEGAMQVRRGSLQLATGVGTSIRNLYAHYNDPSLTAYPVYAVSGTNVYRTTKYATPTSIQSGLDVNAGDGAFASYKSTAYFSSGAVRFRDDGTNVTEWVKQYPTGALSLATNTGAALTVTSTWTCSEGVGGPDSGTATGTVDSTTLKVEFDSLAMTTTNLNTNAGVTIDDYGVYYLDIQLSNPKTVTKISQDYSIGDTSFKNYYHAELDLTDTDFFSALPNVDVLIDSQLSQTGTNTAIDQGTHDTMISVARRRQRPTAQKISSSKVTFNVWAVPRTDFSQIGPSAAADWTNIQAVRFIVETTDSTQVAKITNWQIRGDTKHPLNDVGLGIAYWETFAAYDGSGNFLWESAASPPSARMKMQSAQVVITSTNTATGTMHGFTHRHFYRQGGYMPVPYRVGTASIAVFTFTDSKDDITVLSDNEPMPTNLRGSLPNIAAISEPFHERIFLGSDNYIMWSLPGSPESVPVTSENVVSFHGDNIQKIIAWPQGLIIVNLSSVYEMTGQNFEGVGADYVIQRSNSIHGSIAPKATIWTPYGVLLVAMDGLWLYQPGVGRDVPIEWFNNKAGIAFKGYGQFDPAALGGYRVPPIDLARLNKIVAAYREGRVYLGVPTSTDTMDHQDCNALYVLDFPTQRFWYYTYPTTFNALIWDWVDNKMVIGQTDGTIRQIETGLLDIVNGSNTDITWAFRSRAWTAPTDTLLENAMVEFRGGNGTLNIIKDGTDTQSLGTLSSSNKDYSIPPILGSIGRNLVLDGTGTQTALGGGVFTVYNLSFDVQPHPARVNFYRTEYFPKDVAGENLWDVWYGDMEILNTVTTTGTVTNTTLGTVSATVFVDNSAVMTVTCSNSAGDRQVFTQAFPFDTFGKIAYTVYNGTAGTRFKLWASNYDARPEPPRVNNWQTTKQSLEEYICDGVDADVMPNGTMFGTAYVDNTATLTTTLTGTKRQSFTWAFPNELYGRTIFVNYTGTAFKHYNTWYHLRQEPDRWQNFVTDRVSGPIENYWRHFDVDINPLGTNVFTTAYVDGTAVATYTITASATGTGTATNTGRHSYVFSFPEDTYGRTVWFVHNSNGGRFKHYRTTPIGTPEPDRVAQVQFGPISMAADHYVKTWVAELNPLGTCFGTFIADGTAVMTATFTGTQRDLYQLGMPNITVTDQLLVNYNAATGQVMKHYNSWFETDPKPYLKTTWLVEYRKPGGATQLDMARFYDLDVELASGTSTGTVTSTWFVDGTGLLTNTITLTQNRTYLDRIPFPPGGHGYLFQQQATSAGDFRIWRSNLDIERIGVKGLSRTTVVGRPTQTGELGQPVRFRGQEVE